MLAVRESIHLCAGKYALACVKTDSNKRFFYNSYISNIYVYTEFGITSVDITENATK